MSSTNNDSVIHKGLSVVSFASVLVGLIMSIVFAARALGTACNDSGCQSMLFITTTFLSTRRIETTVGWPVATERTLSDAVFYPNNFADTAKDRSYRFGHFLECMHAARMVDKTCSPDLSFKDYAFCLTNTTAVVQGLDQCASFPTVGNYYHWPTPEEYLGCLWNNPLLRNSESRRASQNVFRSCVDRSMWPFFEIPQGIDTSVFMGSYNWALLLVAGFVLMTSFGVYQASIIESGYISQGESGFFMRLGLFWSGLALFWNVAFFGVFLAVAFRGSGEFQNNGGLPTTASTTFVTFLVFGAGVMYFFFVVFNHPRRTGRYMTRAVGGGMGKIVQMLHGETLPDPESRLRLLGATFPKINPETNIRSEGFELTAEQVARYYTPPLLATWADSYLADFCIFLGMAGVTGQLSTDRAWNLFALTFVYRLLNMIISRCISDAFTNNLRLQDDVNSAKKQIHSRPGSYFMWNEPRERSSEVFASYHLNVQVIGLTTQLAALYLYIGLLVLVFDGPLNDFNVFKTFVVLGFLVPEILRLLLHLGLQLFADPSKDQAGVPWGLYNISFAIWLWDYVVRLIFIGVALMGSADTPGTFEFLKAQTNSLMGSFVTAMGT